MAVTHHESSSTIRGIKYNYGDSFKCYASNSGATSSEGSGSALSLTVGETYVFKGYATDDDNGGELTPYPYLVYSTSGNVRGWYKENVFPYAKYTVSYNANGGSGAPSSQTKTYGTALTLSSTKPTRTGYTFKGWALTKNDADNGTWYYQAGSSCGKNENLTLYAVWDANSYTYNIIYKSSSGNQLGTGTVSKDFGTTNTISPKSFTGYATPSSQSVKWDSTSAKTITFTYTPYKLTVNYYSNYATHVTYQGNAKSVSASTNVLVHSQDFLYDNAVSSGLADVQNAEYVYIARIGYTPTGYWGTSTSGGTLIDQSTTYSTGQALAQAFGKSLANGNASVNIYPQWQINNYTFLYNANSSTATGTMDSMTVEWNETFIFPNNAFKREGYKFVGWHVRRNADSTWYVVGQGWLTESEIVNGGYEKKLYQSQEEHVLGSSWVKGDEYTISNYTMYAQWEISGVVYIDNGTTFEPYLAYIDNGTDWELYLMYVDDGINWNIIS